MKRTLLLLVALLGPLGAVAEGVVSDRKTRLTTGWEFVLGDGPAARDGSAAVRWSQVQLPHCYNALDALAPHTAYYKGPAWYRTQLVVSNPFRGGRTLLEFTGAGQQTQVYADGRLVASHTGGYDVWTVDLTEAVARARQAARSDTAQGVRLSIAVRCDNSHDERIVPSDLSDFNLYGGLYRPVNLVYVPAAYVEHLHVTPTLDAKRKSARVRVDVGWRGAPPQGCHLEVVAPDGRPVARYALADTTITFTLKRAQLWDVEQPRLYALRLVTPEQQLTTHFGLRSAEFKEHGPFLLNGRRLLLRGTHRHEDHAGVGAAMTDEQTRREMVLIKRMGANFIRLGHYQQSDLVLSLCDSLGLLVWEETPWCRNTPSPAVAALTRRLLAAMIDRHYNHPSILVWGMGNEVDWNDHRAGFNRDSVRALLAELAALTHRLDLCGRPTALRRADFAADCVEVYSPSIWMGWYGGPMGGYRQKTLEAIARYPRFLHVEWGADSHAGRHSEAPTSLGKMKKAPARGDWSESYAVRLFDWTLKEQLHLPQLTGTAFWTFKDFSTPLRPENPIPYVNQKGVVTRDLQPKESYYVVQSYWAREPMLHIYGHTWPVRWGGADEEKEFLVYSNCRRVELFLNGRSLGVRRRQADDFPAAGLHWRAVPAAGRNHLRAVACDGSGLSDEISFDYQTQTWGKPARMELSLQAVHGDTARAEVRLYDAHGVFCPDAQNFVEFELAGDGRLLCDLGTPDGSRRIGCQNGRACIRFVRTGPVAVSAKSRGLATQIKTW